MGIIKLGDRLTIPGKNIKGEVAFIGETHFSDGIWFGIILDDAVGKHNGTVENKRYFKCARNHGMFIKDTYFEKTCADIHSIIEKRCRLISKKIKNPNYQNAGIKPKTETADCGSESTINHQKEPQTENDLPQNVVGDNETNNNDDNKNLTKITECGDNSDASDEKKFQFVKRYPNYLKASSKIPVSHFCLNRTKGNKTDHVTDAGDHLTNTNIKNVILPDSHDNTDKDDTECRKRFIYPNYLKASSKLVRKHFCVTKHNDTSDDGTKDSPEKNMEMQTSRKITDNIDNSDDPHAHLIKYPYHQKPSNFKENHLRSTKKIEMKNVNFIHDILDKNTELEALQRENEELKNKLKNTEICLQETLNKYNEAQEENKHLKYDNECQRKQIKFQKSHLKLLKMSQFNYFKKTNISGMRSNKHKQKKIGDFIESSLNEHSKSNENAFDEKFGLDDINATPSIQRVVELEEQNRLMIHGLLELRDFLKKQTELQTNESDPLNFDSCGRNRSNRKGTFSESFSRSSVLNPETYTTEDSTSQNRECSEMLRELRKFNELVNEKKKYVKDWNATNLEAESLEYADSEKILVSNNFNSAALQTAKTSLNTPAFNTNTEVYVDNSKDKMHSETLQNSSTLKEIDNQGMYNAEINQSLFFQSKATTIDEKFHKYYPEDEITFDLADNFDESSNAAFTTDLIFNEDNHFSNPPLIEKDILEKQDFENIENSTFRKSDILPDIQKDLSSNSTDMNIKTSGNCPKQSLKRKRFDKKLPVSNELRPDVEMSSMNK